MTEILFELTKDHLETGLRGVPIGYCPTSFVDPKKGLHYSSYPVHKLSSWEPEEVIYLLFYGNKPDSSQLETFCQELKKRQNINEKVLQHIEKLPKEGQAMEVFSCALMILGMLEKTEDYEQDCLNLIAKLPFLTASVINYHAGFGKTLLPDPNLGYMENFTRMLAMPNKNEERLLEIFKLFNILHYDHGGGNLSCFTGKVVASGRRHLYGAISSSINALAGYLHGKANQDGLEFVQKIAGQLQKDFSEKAVGKVLKKHIESQNLIFGFGHAVLRVEDPRATILYSYANKYFPDHELVKTAHLLRTVGSKILAENPKVQDPHPNVDAISGTALYAAGFCYPEYFPVLFGLSRCVGIAIQILYERKYARGGKGTPIMRPRYIFKPR